MKLSYRCGTPEAEAIAIEVTPLPDREGWYRVSVGEQVLEVSVHLLHRGAVWKDAEALIVQYEGRQYRLFDATQRRRVPQRQPGDLRAPMAGKVIQVCVQPGSAVQEGDVLLILEAMKMEQPVLAPHAGTVVRLLCHAGQQVSSGAELIVLERPPEVTSQTDQA